MMIDEIKNLNIAPSIPTQKEAFWYWLKLGFISFGGPAGQIAIMHHDLVEKKRWISEKRFLHALNYCMMLPGPEAQQLATYIGWLMHKTSGGLIAGGLFILPSLLILIMLSTIYIKFGNLPLVAGVLYGIKPAVLAIVLFAAYRIGSKVLKNKALWGISVVSFLLITFFKLPFPTILLMAALTGWLIDHYHPQLFTTSKSHCARQVDYGKAAIDDDTPTPTHAKFNLKTCLKWLLIGLGIWITAMLLLMLHFGWTSTPTQMGWFFTKAALLTFGGAYAVLPYVFQGAVGHYQWVSAAQMMDGLALGETTPGPLIMVVTFVGFIGGWQQPFLGEGSALLSAIFAACLVTFFTFLPSFIFILFGAPFIESTQNIVKLTAPLTAITAAVVGVIISLAVFFGLHIFWPNGYIHFVSAIDWVAVIAALSAGIALFKYKISIIRLIGIFALLGLLISVFKLYL